MDSSRRRDPPKDNKAVPLMVPLLAARNAWLIKKRSTGLGVGTIADRERETFELFEDFSRTFSCTRDGMSEKTTATERSAHATLKKNLWMSSIFEEFFNENTKLLLIIWSILNDYSSSGSLHQ